MNWQERDSRAEEMRKQFAGKIDAVAALLGATVKRDEERDRDDRAELTLADGLTFSMNLNTYEGRAYARPSWPQDIARGNYYPSGSWTISLAPDRPAAAMAKDIERRFLAKYRPAFLEYKTQAEKRNANYRESLAFSQELAAETNQPLRLGNNHRPGEPIQPSDMSADRIVDLGPYGREQTGHGDLRISPHASHFEIKYYPNDYAEARHIALAIANYRARVTAADRSAPRPANPEMIPAAIEEQPELPALERQPELALGAGKNIVTLALPEDADADDLDLLIHTSVDDARNYARGFNLATLLAARAWAEAQGRKSLRATLQIEINRRNKQQRKAA